MNTELSRRQLLQLFALTAATALTGCENQSRQLPPGFTRIDNPYKASPSTALETDTPTLFSGFTFITEAKNFYVEFDEQALFRYLFHHNLPALSSPPQQTIFTLKQVFSGSSLTFTISMENSETTYSYTFYHKQFGNQPQDPDLK